MLREKDLSNGFASGGGGENSVSNRPSQSSTAQNDENPHEKVEFSEKGIDFLRESEMDRDRFQLKPSKVGTSASQELTLSYLCEKENPPKLESKNLLNSWEKPSNYKGKEVVSENSSRDERWVERDFLRLNETRLGSSKREIEQVGEEEARENERENREKKQRLETLNLSLALPDVSLSLTSSNPDGPIRPKPTRSMQSLPVPSNNNTQTTCSNDFTSYSYSHPFSHNPSCSLTRNSTDCYEHSIGSVRRESDQIWYGGEGTNGSVHSRFKPIGDGVALANNHGAVAMQSTRPVNKESCHGLHRTTSSENHSFFPSELPARPRCDTQSADSRGRRSESQRGFENFDGNRARKVSRPERIIRDIVTESVPVVCQMIKELTDETVQLTKEYLRSLIGAPERREELVALQNRIERRSDLTKETLLKAHKDQLDILVAIKTGLGNFLSSKNRLPPSELVEIFLLMRCKNVDCKSLLPVDDCDCKICTKKKGFCSACMCPVCLKFDCASNTCSWVGCDVCSHWCHAACGIQKNLIRPVPKGTSGTSEMHFHCLGCDHASEMFGFVKDVFVCCAKVWGLETLIKELDCVRKIFMGSEDFKGKELHIKASEMLSKLENKRISPKEACNYILQFFHHTDGMSEVPCAGDSLKEITASESGLSKDAVSLPPLMSLPPRSTYNTSCSSLQYEMLPRDIHQSNVKSSSISERKNEDEFRLGNLMKNDAFDSLESIVRIKEAEAMMFQTKADEARREADGYRRIVRTKSVKLEEEYAEKLAKLCLQETEERRKKKLEELKLLESSHWDYHQMKRRMQTEIAGLLERMEATKQQWV
ncbi:Oberon, coiled-coil region [Dillenia turbinata]|uniref:Oberon, coiled-coil region n=1 Tax=Dillenia turbinata TaxID=194707 RepID=A0AAN8Z206_9MAGN